MQTSYQFTAMAPTRAEGPLATLLRRGGRTIGFSSGQVIQQRGDRGDGFWMIESGRVSICRFGRDGGVTVFAVLGEGDLFGELAHFTGTLRQVDAVAESEATLVKVGAAQIERLLATEPDFSRWLLTSLANQLRAALDRIDQDRNLQAEARLAQLLLDLFRRRGPDLPVTQQALADWAGMSRVTAGQVLRHMARLGAIQSSYGRIAIVDPSALAALAGAD